jgi:hypothetical protein
MFFGLDVFCFIECSAITLMECPQYVMESLCMDVADGLMDVLRCRHTSHTQTHPAVTDYIDSLPLTLVLRKANWLPIRLYLNAIERQSVSWA